MVTQKQIADKLGVDKQRVYRYIKKHNIQGSRCDDGTILYDEAEETVIISGLSKNNEARQSGSETPRSTSKEAVMLEYIATLEKELEIKNKQIEDLNLRLAESNAALVSAQQMVQAEQTLHAGSIQSRLLTDGKEKGSLWNKIFKKKN